MFPGLLIADSGSTAGKWDGFSLFSARALLAGLTMLGLTYSVVLFFSDEVLFSSGYSDTVWRSTLVIGIGYGSSCNASGIGTGHLSIVRRYCDSEDGRFPSFFAVILSLVD